MYIIEYKSVKACMCIINGYAIELTKLLHYIDYRILKRQFLYLIEWSKHLRRSCVRSRISTIFSVLTYSRINSADLPFWLAG